MSASIGGSTAAAELKSLAPAPHRPPNITPSEHLARMTKARALCASCGADALLINAGASLRYFTGVSWAASERLVAFVLPVDGEPFMMCPAFEQGSLQASLAIPIEATLWQEDESPTALLAQRLAARKIRTLAVDPALAFTTYNALHNALPALQCMDAAGIVDGCRGEKSATELACLHYAKALTLDVHRRVARILHQGITTGEVRRFIDAAHRAAGADGGSTFCLVQFGIATAYPHGIPGEQALNENELVLIDTGCQVNGYNADITRTYVFGTPTAEHRRIWAIEKEAQAAAFAAAKPGVPCEQVDAAARAVLSRYGLGPDYALPGLPHRTGHGVGLSVHEGPYLVRGDRTPLAKGMCFSNEPMIVLPDQFGVRLEDHFYITDSGAAWFTEPSHSIDQPFG